MISLRGGDFSAVYYQHGNGEQLVFLHDMDGLPSFTSDLEALSRHFSVTAPLMPGFGSSGEEHLHEEVQKLVFWVWDLLDELKIDHPILIGHSFGGMVAAEMAATEPRRVKKLVLAAPAGLFLDECPTLDFFAATPAQSFHNPESETAKAFMKPPADPDAAAEFMVARNKALATAGRFLWPNGDRGLAERLYRIKAPTLLLRGQSDKVIPPAYADVFERMMSGSASVKIQKITAAGHALLAEQPQASVTAIIDFCTS
jgi:pimeloyl-ACP methyl ester carboxylesterase